MLRRRLFAFLAGAPMAGLAAAKAAEAKPAMSLSAVNDAVRKMIGEIRACAGEKAPPDCLWCYGQAVSRTAYADLFKAIGTIYGPGDGKTTFNLPDLRGRVPAGHHVHSLDEPQHIHAIACGDMVLWSYPGRGVPIQPTLVLNYVIKAH